MKSSTAVGKSTAPTAVALLGQFDRVSPPSVTVVTASVVAARFLTTTACAVRLLATPRFPPTFKSPARVPPVHARVSNHKTIMRIFIVHSFRVRSSGFGGGGGDDVLALGVPPFSAGNAGHGLEAVGSRIVTRGEVEVVRHSDLLILLHSDPGLLHATPTRGSLSILTIFVNI